MPPPTATATATINPTPPYAGPAHYGPPTTNAKAERTITLHVWRDARERTDANRLTSWGKAIYKRRKETVERSFADAEQRLGHRYARFRGITGVTCQCLLAAAAQNIKKNRHGTHQSASPNHRVMGNTTLTTIRSICD